MTTPPENNTTEDELPQESPPTSGGGAETNQTLIAWGVVGALALLFVGLSCATVYKKKGIDDERKSARAGGKPPTEVVVQEVKVRDVVDRLRLPAKADAWSEVWISAEAAGRVMSVEVVEGNDVQAGAVLCRIDDRDYRSAVDAARAALEGAKAARSLASTQMGRMGELRRSDAVGQSEYDQADAGLAQASASVEQATAGLARANLALERTVVCSPVSGTVSQVPVKVGQLIGPGARVARVVELDKIKVTVGIPEIHATKAKKLSTVALTLKALPGRTFVGTIERMGVEPEEHSHVYSLELVVDNKDRAILPGMFVTADVVLEVRRKPVVRLWSVIPREKDKIVFVAEDGVARRRAIGIGLIMGSTLTEAEVEITAGLAGGEKLIVQGQRRVEDGDGVTIVSEVNE